MNSFKLASPTLVVVMTTFVNILLGSCLPFLAGIFDIPKDINVSLSSLYILFIILLTVSFTSQFSILQKLRKN